MTPRHLVLLPVLVTAALGVTATGALSAVSDPPAAGPYHGMAENALEHLHTIKFSVNGDQVVNFTVDHRVVFPSVQVSRSGDGWSFEKTATIDGTHYSVNGSWTKSTHVAHGRLVIHTLHADRYAWNASR